MRVVLELVSGSGAGRRISLMRNQEVCIGQSAWSEFAVADDQHMADKHFRLETDLQVCRVFDLGSGKGTWLNDQAVASAVVRDGDRVRAGNSEFVVHIEGDVSHTGDRQQDLVKPARMPVAPKMQPINGNFTVGVCKTGLFQVSGRADVVGPDRLAQKLGEMQPLNAMVDFRRVEGASPHGFREMSYLFDWFGEAAALNSPVLLSSEDGELLPVILKGWRCNAIVCLFSNSEKQALATHLRSFVRTGDSRIVGICWPSILDVLLQHYRQDYVQGLMQPFAGLLVESSSEENVWHLYSRSDMSKTLEMIGLQKSDANND
jgi:hypothetical protein